MKIFLILIGILIFFFVNLSMGQEDSRLKVLSLEDIKKWNFQMTRKDIYKIVSPDAVLLVTMHAVAFKAKEGGAYKVNFTSTPGKPFAYKLYSIYYYPKYPDFPYELIMEDTSLPPLPKVPLEER